MKESNFLLDMEINYWAVGTRVRAPFVTSKKDLSEVLYHGVIVQRRVSEDKAEIKVVFSDGDQQWYPLDDVECSNIQYDYNNTIEVHTSNVLLVLLQGYLDIVADASWRHMESALFPRGNPLAMSVSKIKLLMSDLLSGKSHQDMKLKLSSLHSLQQFASLVSDSQATKEPPLARTKQNHQRGMLRRALLPYARQVTTAIQSLGISLSEILDQHQLCARDAVDQ